MMNDDASEYPVIIAYTYAFEHEDGRRDTMIINRIEGVEPPETIAEDGVVYRLESSRVVERC